MVARLKLEAFDGPCGSRSDAAKQSAASAAAVEDVRLASYENGYSAGWEDAVAAQSGDELRIREDLARNLRDLSFTYQEARAHLLRGLEPLLRGMVDLVLPELARATLGASVVEQLLAEAGQAVSAPVTLCVSPGNRAAIEAALGEATALPVTLLEEPTLGDGQVRFRFEAGEHDLDQQALIAAVRGLVGDFLNARDERQPLHG